MAETVDARIVSDDMTIPGPRRPNWIARASANTRTTGAAAPVLTLKPARADELIE
jgi:hypothetical protein